MEEKIVIASGGNQNTKEGAEYRLDLRGSCANFSSVGGGINVALPKELYQKLILGK